MNDDIFKKKRAEVEQRIDTLMSILDKTGSNSQYYRKIFSGMSDVQFKKFWAKQYPLRFHTRPMEIEPNMSVLKEAADFVGVKLVQKVKLPYLYTNKDGIPVSSQDCQVGWNYLKKVQQMVIKKNKNAIEIGGRDMRTGRLSGDDKGAAESDREFESLFMLGFINTADELSRPKADALRAKSVMHNDINILGYSYLKDIPMDPSDSLGKNMMNIYMLGAHLDSNLISASLNSSLDGSSKTRNIKRM